MEDILNNIGLPKDVYNIISDYHLPLADDIQLKYINEFILQNPKSPPYFRAISNIIPLNEQLNEVHIINNPNLGSDDFDFILEKFYIQEGI